MMNTLKHTLFLVLLLPIGLMAQSDEEAIKAVMAAETEAFFQRDYDAWAATWVQDETVFHAWNTREGGYVMERGWKALSESIRQYIADHPEPSHPNFHQRNFVFSIQGDVATVSYDEYASNREGDRFTLAPGYKVFRKEDGEWKLAAVCSYWDYEYEIKAEDIPE